jgi:hypothetical protein
MSQTKKNRALSGFSICLLFFTMMLQYGCLAASALKGKPGLDVSPVKIGMSKSDVEEVLGGHNREWVTSSGIVYCVYGYDAGVPPSVGDATAHIVMDIISLGAWELALALQPFPEFRRRDQMAVSYDINGMALGVFDHFGDFDLLPEDGRVEK